VRLLVSVRDEHEAARAVAGGAEIIDGKDPFSGPIAPVRPSVLEAIRGVVPARLRVSAALGDVMRPEDVARAFASLPAGIAFVKLGFLGIRSGVRVQALLTEAAVHAAEHPGRPAVIAVAYADHGRTGTLPPRAFPAAISAAGADGLLIDTAIKAGGHLFDLLAPADLAAIGRELEADELTFALGGSLRAEHVRAAAETGATILGVRGAACVGGRDGDLSEQLVRQLADAVRADRASTRY
jgi:uncharacterized protein (UPF0264 family)